MADPKRLSDLVKAGRDYEAKVKIADVLGHEVILTSFDHVQVYEEKPDEHGELRPVLTQDYWNVAVEDDGVKKTFSTGAVPIVKVLKVLDQTDLPLLCTFSAEGRTYLIE